MTLVLVSVFVYLAVQGNRLEKERKKNSADIVETYEATPVRTLNPRDLEITQATIKISTLPGEQPSPVARHRIEIRNRGKVTYSELLLKLEYRDAHNAEIGFLSRKVKENIPPGDTVLSIELPANTIPDSTVECMPTIEYADFEPG